MHNIHNLSQDKINIFQRNLLKWYHKAGRRHLPWRTTDDPYAIWISEIMLQQTQVQTVLERYYFPFLASFPTLVHLAKAPQEKVLKCWQGLGYYNRAINLHRTACICAQDNEGMLPAAPPFAQDECISRLQALPGIGRNTAHAVAAFAYHLPVAVMEANVKRVISRIFAMTEPVEKDLWHNASLLLDSAQPFNYNQAMMDIGAIVCTKRAPDCAACPANSICAGKETPELYPAVKKKPKTPVRKRNIIVVEHPDGRYFAQPRTSRFLHGLYQFVEVERHHLTFALAGDSYTLNKARSLGVVKHVYSHFTLQADIYHYRLETAVASNGWYTLEELRSLPHSKAEEKIIALLT